MNILFVYSFSNLYTSLAKYSGGHKCAFITFRREYAGEKVSPLYVVDMNSVASSRHGTLLTEQEIEDSFQYSQAMKFVNKRVKRIVDLGRKYEQAYLDVVEREGTECIVMHNSGYGFQQIGFRLGRMLGLRILVTENGYFHPLTLTVENTGVNAHSVMQQWHGGWVVSQDEQLLFESFIRFWSEHKETAKPIRSAITRLSNEIRERFFYDDCEGYDHSWTLRFRKYLWNWRHTRSVDGFTQGEEFLCLFVSSVYDPQLPNPSWEYVDEIVIKVLEAFKAFSSHHPPLKLLIKEHPLDRSRILLRYHSRVGLYNNVVSTDADTNLLIRNARGILTINSTVGIKALLEDKALLCLGNALYNHPELCLRVEEPLTPQKIGEALTRLMEFIPNQHMTHSFLTSLFVKTQIAATHSVDIQESMARAFFDRLVSKS